jgi:hypothetical protein
MDNPVQACAARCKWQTKQELRRSSIKSDELWEGYHITPT